MIFFLNITENYGMYKECINFNQTLENIIQNENSRKTFQNRSNRLWMLN